VKRWHNRRDQEEKEKKEERENKGKRDEAALELKKQEEEVICAGTKVARTKPQAPCRSHSQRGRMRSVGRACASSQQRTTDRRIQLWPLYLSPRLCPR
jgi:hypothetical protein